MKKKEINEHIKICKNLIKILKNQIVKVKSGKMKELFGENPSKNIKHWEKVIRKHKRTIISLKRLKNKN